MKVYVSKESKKEETKSTAYSFLLVSVFGFIALILFATGVLPVHVADYMKIMLCIVTVSYTHLDIAQNGSVQLLLPLFYYTFFPLSDILHTNRFQNKPEDKNCR